MTPCRTPVRLALAAVLALSAFAASAATSALSENEMSGVYGRGLSDPTLVALGALGSVSEQNNASAADTASTLGAISASNVQALDRQLAQQRLQTATVSMQTTLKLAQTMAAVTQVLAPIASLGALPILGLFTPPMLANLGALETATKH